MKENKLKTTSTNGITLIALIITIIVMLILVGVTVSIAINGGLFANTKKAKTDTQNALNAENELSEGKVNIDGKIYNSIDEYIGSTGNQGEATKGNWTLSEDGNTVTDGNVTLNIGDYVNYTYDTPADAYSLPTTITGYTEDKTINQETDLKWRVLGVDTNGCLVLISNRVVGDNDVYLDGVVGYNNGVFILNDICAKLYSNEELGIYARSLTIEDVEEGFSEQGLTRKNKYENYIKYGQTRTYANCFYPIIYAQENGSGIGVTEDKASIDIKKDGIGVSDSYYSESQLTNKPEGKEYDKASALTCTQTYYDFGTNTPATYCKNDTFYNMVFQKQSDFFWLASRCCFVADRFVGFRIFQICDSNFDGTAGLSWGCPTECNSSSRSGSGRPWGSLRPVISLGYDIILTKCDVSADGTDSNHMHSLSKAN